VKVEARAITGKARQPASIEMMSSVMPSAKKLLLRIAAKIGKRQDRDGAPVVEARRLAAQDRRGGAEVFGLLGRLAAHPVDVDRSPDVLELLRAEILEVEVDPVDDLVVDDPGDVDAARFGPRFEPCRDVDAVAKTSPASMMMCRG